MFSRCRYLSYSPRNLELVRAHWFGFWLQRRRHELIVCQHSDTEHKFKLQTNQVCLEWSKSVVKGTAALQRELFCTCCTFRYQSDYGRFGCQDSVIQGVRWSYLNEHRCTVHTQKLQDADPDSGRNPTPVNSELAASREHGSSIRDTSKYAAEGNYVRVLDISLN